MKKARKEQREIRQSLEFPAPLGMFGFGVTALLVHLNNAGLFPVDPSIIGFSLAYGGVLQIAVGIWEWRSRRPFGAVFFSSFGFFWLALVALTIFPRVGLGLAPPATVLAPLLVFWGLFALGLGGGSIVLGPLLPVLFGTTALSFFFQAAGVAMALQNLLILAAYTGLLSSFIALFVSAVQLTDFITGRPPTLFGWARR